MKPEKRTEKKGNKEGRKAWKEKEMETVRTRV